MVRIGRNLAILVLAACFLAAILKSVEKYSRGQVAVSSMTEVKTEFRFPSVTVCNLDNDWLTAPEQPERGFGDLMSDPFVGAPYVHAYLVAGRDYFE